MDKYLGKRLDGRYEMRELIGIGGMAYVYKAYDSVDDRVVAVKILKDEYLNNQEFVRRFRNESKAIAILNHENIVKVLDVGFGERLQYIVMEYIDGITLKEYLDQRKEIRWKEAVHFAIQILRALQHAHDKGIVHRDIKPQNVMLLSDGTIKVTDFGIARLTRSEMQVTVAGNKAIGSVHYISPEQARGEITDEKADLYSVGIVLYEMLTGKLPFEADNAVSVAIMQMQSEAKAPHLLNSEIPGGLEQITLKAMQKDTTRRYQSAAEMLSDFDEFKRNPSIQFEYTYFEDETPTRYVDAITRVRGTEAETKTEKKVPEKKQEKKAKKKGRMSVTDVVLPVVAAFVVVAIVALLLVFVVFPGDGANEKNDVVVPKFIGLTREEADDLAVEKGFTIKYYDQEFREEFEPGKIYNQEPPADKEIKEDNAVITLYINAQAPVVRVPGFRKGDAYEEVKERLEKAGFKVVMEVDTIYNAEYEEGAVLERSPKDEELAEGTEIKLLVNGMAQKEGVLPHVEGMDVERAIEKLKERGFLPGKEAQPKITVVNSSDGYLYVKNTVLKMTPAQGKTHKFDEEIELVVASGFFDVTVEMDLSRVNEVVDLKIHVNGVENEELSKMFTKILPQTNATAGKNKFTVGVTDVATYEVKVEVYAVNSGNLLGYLCYEVDGKNGSYKLIENALSEGSSSSEVIEPQEGDTV